MSGSSIVSDNIKVGDKVKVISQGDTLYGKFGTITSVTRYMNKPIHVNVNIDGIDYYFGLEALEKQIKE